jgi:hypothetical protein
VNKKPIDFYTIHQMVEARGGYDEVNAARGWAQIGVCSRYVAIVAPYPPGGGPCRKERRNMPRRAKPIHWGMEPGIG